MKVNTNLAFFSLFILNQSLSAVTVQDLKESAQNMVSYVKEKYNKTTVQDLKESGKQAKVFVEEKYNDTKNWVSENKGKSAFAATLFIGMLGYILKLKYEKARNIKVIISYAEKGHGPDIIEQEMEKNENNLDKNIIKIAAACIALDLGYEKYISIERSKEIMKFLESVKI